MVVSRDESLRKKILEICHDSSVGVILVIMLHTREFVAYSIGKEFPRM